MVSMYYTGKRQGRLQVVLLLDTTQDNALGQGTRDHIGVFLAIAKVHGVAVVSPIKDVLSTFRKASLVFDILQFFTPNATSVDEDGRLWEQAI